MSGVLGGVKRLLVGRPMASDELGTEALPKRTALPVFASDALSSVAYAPDEILLTLSIGGVSAYLLSPWVGLAVAGVLLTVVASYRQTMRAYPSGGGDYEVATTNLGRNAGIGVASALLLDYVLTVAVSLSAASQYLAAVLPALDGHEVPVTMALIAVVTIINVRGTRRGGLAVALPVYLFLGAIGLLAVVGWLEAAAGTLQPAASAGFDFVAEPGFEEGLVGLGGAMLLARAFSSGAAALTGVETVSSNVPAFRRPRARNAGTTLLVLGLASAAMIMAILLLARATGVRYAEVPHLQLTADGVPLPENYHQHPVIGQVAAAVFHRAPVMFVLVTSITALVLVLAAHSAFQGFPALASILARDDLLPRQLHTRGDRLVFSNGIITLAIAAMALVWLFDAEVSRLIQLYIVGVFLAFTASQLGMVRHWTNELRTISDPRSRRRVLRSRAVNAFGLGLTAFVLVIVLITKFTRGAWLTLLAMAVLFVLMRLISRHYARVRDQVTVADLSEARALPSRVHAVVLISRLHQPSMRALAYARATRPATLEVITVGVDPEEVAALRQEWQELGIPVPLTALDAPYREVTGPVLDHVRALRANRPRDLVVVFVPEYVVGRWWERMLHNQSASRVTSRLMLTPGVVVASVPWQLDSAERAAPSRWDEPILPRREDLE